MNSWQARLNLRFRRRRRIAQAEQGVQEGGIPIGVIDGQFYSSENWLCRLI